ncbi:hypothetical protein ACXR0O_09465 [Verrucomicrobiota bacterium sgz303538]
MTEEQLRALLRVKRHEQPPPGYFDQLLRDIHRRQRAELLRRPLWKIALERMQTFFGEHSMSHASYAGAMATLLIVGVGVIGIVTPGDSSSGTNGSATLASANGNAVKAQQSSHLLRLQSPAASERLVSSGKVVSGSRPVVPAVPAARHPRYVIDARPVSYEPTFSF